MSDIENTVNGKRKLKRTYRIMLIVGILMDVIEIGTLVYGIIRGVWWPFIIGMSVVIAAAIILVRMYYRNTAYICPECGAKFRPAFGNFMFARHTRKTRKLKCTHCGYDGYCIETYTDDQTTGGVTQNGL
jgi:DNA-directed RNA polymerase subunit RPC12/RpoP